MNRNELLVVVIAVGLMAIPISVMSYSVITNTVVDDLTYETDTGLEVTATDPETLESPPVVGNDTWQSVPLRLSSDGPASATVSDAAFDRSAVGIESVDARRNPVTVNRSDIGAVELDGRFDQFSTPGIDTGDEQPDFSYQAGENVTVSVSGVPPNSNVAAVDEGQVVATDTAPNPKGTATFQDLPSGEQAIRVAELPAELSIRDVTDGSLINDTETDVNLTPVDATEPITQQTTDNGRINMTGLPIDTRFAADLAPEDNYLDREIRLPARINQQPAYLLPDDGSVASVSPRLTVDDETGRFNEEASTVRLQRPVPTESGTEYRTVAGDRLGTDGFSTALQRNQRYRVIIVDPTAGQTHVTTVTPRTNEPTAVPIRDVQYGTTESVSGINISTAYRRPERGDRLAVNLSNVQSADLSLSEAGNRSNVVLDESYEQNVSADVPVPEEATESNWNADYEATNTNDATISGRQAIDNPTRQEQREEVARAILSILLVVVLGSVAMRVAPALGGVVIVITAGLLWIAGWMPVEIGVPTIGVGMVIGVLGVLSGGQRSL
ncbi:MAG: hypothetical protein J07HN4v3_01977 [Halonotius sp. J07HN4]|nr:MAG: hypothetical protein J07HN4v3_01977 [Halonotius sp. J07HN4]